MGFKVLGAIVAWVLALAISPAQAGLVVISPIASGVAFGSGYFPIEADFNSQPVWDGTNLIPVGDGASAGSLVYASRYGYIDLGTGYANLRIYQTWTQYNDYAQGDMTIFSGYQWTNGDPTAAQQWDAIGNVPELLLKFSSNTSKPYTDTNNPWYLDADATATPVTPGGRYLLFQANGAPAGRDQEFAIIGEVVPEPTTLLLAVSAAAAMGLRRSRRGN